ncbi:MAG: hypothetical protein AAF725_26350, partial [Acidobacteriota bacterium]
LALIEEPLVRYRVHPRNTLRETAEAGAESEARMRFEILWLLARHAARLCRRSARGGGHGELEERQRRLWASLPRFGCEALLAQLLAWRGEEDLPPASFDRLLEREHPFRTRAEALLRESAG